MAGIRVSMYGPKQCFAKTYAAIQSGIMQRTPKM